MGFNITNPTFSNNRGDLLLKEDSSKAVFFGYRFDIIIIGNNIEWATKNGKVYAYIDFSNLSELLKAGAANAIEWIEAKIANGEFGSDGFNQPNSFDFEIVSNESRIVLPQDFKRTGFIIQNRSGRTAFLRFGAPASTQEYSIRLTNNNIYEATSAAAGLELHAIKQSGGAGDLKVTTF